MPTLSTVHPFPARMAPELAGQSLGLVPKGGRVIDPMCGSGTVMRLAVESSIECVGFDIDPLSVLMSKVWTTRIDVSEVHANAERLVETARGLSDDEVETPADLETEKFMAYWFAPRQRDELGRLATAMRRGDSPESDLLAVAFSRLIISKEMMASLAKDTSHSRPHRVEKTNEFDVYSGFLRSARHVAKRLAPDKIKARADIRLGDARTLDGVDDSSFDLAVTSPPYLNAIDYMRGHKMTLVWLGYKLDELRKVRSANIGAEKILSESAIDVAPFIHESERSRLEARHIGWTRRYASDMGMALGQLKRIVKSTGNVVMVLGNSFLRGAEIDNAGIIKSLAESAGFNCVERISRDIPARRRYLPPPVNDRRNSLDFRMRRETVLTFRHS